MRKLQLSLLAAALAAAGAAHAGHTEGQPKPGGSMHAPLPEHCKEAKAPRVECSPTVSAAFDGKGVAWVAWSDSAHVYAQQSADKGRTWSKPVAVNREDQAVLAHGESRPKVAVGPEGNVYVTWARGLGQRFTSHILFSRSTDGGKTFSKPRIVNNDRQVIGHAFDSVMVGGDGKVLVAWLDGRDAAKAKQEGRAFNGSTVYYTWSDDGGRSFRKDRPIAAGTCQCCRLQTAADRDGLPIVMWRHILEGGIRDHVLVKFQDWNQPGEMARVSFEDWKIDACPHHGPGLSVDPWGRYHAVWFSGEPQRGGLFYAYSEDNGRSFSKPLRLGGQGASHPHVASLGDKVAVAWQEFDGQHNVVKTQTSGNRGAFFGEPAAVAQTEGAADAPFVLSDGQALYLSWQTQKDGYRLLPLP